MSSDTPYQGPAAQARFSAAGAEYWIRGEPVTRGEYDDFCFMMWPGTPVYDQLMADTGRCLLCYALPGECECCGWCGWPNADIDPHNCTEGPYSHHPY